MLTFNLVSLAKNHNFFSQIDNYMKELARISLGLSNKHIQERLEEVLSREIAIAPNLNESSALNLNDLAIHERAVHHNVLAQPHFQFLPRALKA